VPVDARKWICSGWRHAFLLHAVKTEDLTREVTSNFLTFGNGTTSNGDSTVRDLDTKLLHTDLYKHKTVSLKNNLLTWFILVCKFSFVWLSRRRKPIWRTSYSVNLWSRGLVTWFCFLFKILRGRLKFLLISITNVTEINTKYLFIQS